MDRFGNKLERISLRTILAHCPRCIGLCRKEEDPTITQQRANALCRFKTVKPWHDHIAEKNVRPPDLCCPDRARAINHSNGIEPALIEDLFERTGDHRLIICNKDSCLRLIR